MVKQFNVKQDQQNRRLEEKSQRKDETVKQIVLILNL